MSSTQNLRMKAKARGYEFTKLYGRDEFMLINEQGFLSINGRPTATREEMEQFLDGTPTLIQAEEG